MWKYLIPFIFIKDVRDGTYKHPLWLIFNLYISGLLIMAIIIYILLQFKHLTT